MEIGERRKTELMQLFGDLDIFSFVRISRLNYKSVLYG